MAVDTSIYTNLLRPPKSVADFDQEAQASQMNALQLQNGRMKQDEYTRSIADQNALRDATRGFGKDSTANYNALLRTGNLKAAQDYQKGNTDNAKSQAAADKDVLEVTSKKRDTAIMDIAALESPEQARASIMTHLQKGDIDEQKAQMLIAGLPQNPADMPRWQLNMVKGIMTAKDRVADVRHVEDKAEQTRQFGVTSAETGRHNLAGEKVAQGHLGIAGANLNLSRERLATEKAAPKGEIVQTEQGPMLVDKRTGQSRPLLGPDGATLGPKMKDAPAAVQKAMIENGTNLRRAEKALALLEGKEVGGIKGDKNATGIKGYLPNQILNRIDPEGVDTRAQIADLGSLVIHDRSGAAVTASEFPRLAPFIPTEKDDAASAKKKVARFVQVYREEMEASQAAYGPESGYRQLGGASKSAPAAPTGFDADKERRYQEWKAKQK